MVFSYPADDGSTAPGHRPSTEGGRVRQRSSSSEAEPGRLVRVEHAGEIRNHPAVRELHVNFAVGDVMPPVRWSLDRAGYLVVTDGTSDEARDLAESPASRLTFVTEPVGDEEELATHRDAVAGLDQAARLAAVDPAP